MEKGGGWKTSRMTPLPKMGFGPPLVRYVFHPPQASALCFSCTKIHDRADQKLFWRGPKIFGRACSLVRFPPPIRFVRSEKLQNESFPNFSSFRPEFCPEFCSEFSPNFSRTFRASFRGRRRPEKIHQKSPPFFNAKFPGKHEKNIHKILLESRQSNVLHPPISRPSDFCSLAGTPRIIVKSRLCGGATGPFHLDLPLRAGPPPSPFPPT